MTTDCARRFLLYSVWMSFAFTTLLAAGYAQKPAAAFKPVVPRTWDEQAFAELELPLAVPSHSPKHISADEYYRLPDRVSQDALMIGRGSVSRIHTHF
jgi:hypothetical protein